MLSIKQILDDQRKFGHQVGQFDNNDCHDKFDMTKTLLLGLHNEVSQVANTFNYRQHYDNGIKFDRNKFVYECVDVVRYVAALLNTHNISSENFENAINVRSKFLEIRNKLEKNKWNYGQPVIVVDVDDVLGDFRLKFNQYLKYRGVDVSGSENDEAYYSTNRIISAGLNPSELFDSFINNGGMNDLPACEWLVDELNALYNNGYFIQILTARPIDNPMTHYVTYTWLEKVGLSVNAIDFTPEKYNWLTAQEYFQKDFVAFAIDDSPKHCTEYALHDVKVLAPLKSYNVKVLNGHKNVSLYSNHDEFVSLAAELLVKNS